MRNYARKCIKNFNQHMFWIVVRIASLKERRSLCYILFCPLRILYNSKFILMSTSLGTNAVIVMRVHCMWVHLVKTLLS